MDPRDYVLHNHARSSATQYDPVHAATNSWGPQPNPPPSRASSFPWQQSSSLHRLPTLMTNPDPYQIPSNGGLPPPHSGFYGAPVPGDFLGPTPQQFHHPYGRLPPTRHGQDSSVRSGDAFLHQLPGPERPLSFPPPGGIGVLSAGNNHELDSLPHPSHPPSGLPTNGFTQHHNAPPFSLPPPGPITSTPPRRNHYSSGAPSARPPRDVHSFTRPPQLAPSRRSHQQTRIRRSMSTSRPADFIDEDEEAMTRQFIESLRASGFNGPIDGSALDDQLLRQIQLVRGSRDMPQVASRKTIQSLQSVKIEDLDESDRVCIICYNEFGTVSPEGINEAPLRLPKCKHVFGDHCIKKWFENSDKCPYCRDKVPSEPARLSSPSRAFLTLMRMRTQQQSLRVENDATVRDITRMTSAERESGNRQNQTGGRRSPPDDAGGRRTRARHSNPSMEDTSSTPPAPTSSAPSAPITPSIQSAPAAPTAPSAPSAPLPIPFPSAGTTPALPHTSSSQRRLGSHFSGSTQHTRHRPAMSWDIGGVNAIQISSSSTSMSGSGFYSHGPSMDYRTLPRDNQLLNLPIPPPPISSILPNPLQSASDLAQERRRQQDGMNGSGFRTQLVNMSVGRNDGSQASPDQDNRIRPW